MKLFEKNNEKNYILDVFYPLLKKYKKNIIILFLIPVCGATTEAFSPYTLKLIVDAIQHSPSNNFTHLSFIFIPIALYVLLATIFEICMRLEEYIESKTTPIIRAEIQEVLFEHTLKHSYRFFQDNLSGSIANKVLNISNSFEKLYKAWQQGLYPVLLSFSISSVLMLTVNWNFSAILMSWFIIMLGTTIIYRKECLKRAGEFAEAESCLAGRIVDTFQNSITVSRYFKHKDEILKLLPFKNRAIHKNQELSWYLLKLHFIQGVACISMLIAMSSFLVHGLMASQVTAGDFVYILSTTFWLIRTTWWASVQLLSIFKEVGVIKQSLFLIKKPYEINDNINSPDLIVKEGRIDFQNVSFSFEEENKLFISQNVSIHGRQKVGLVGKSGSGKTSFINLILRFFDLDEGRILIDGQNIKEVSLSSLRNIISVIPQDPILFHRSIYENICYAKPDAGKNEVIAASCFAHSHDFIDKLPNKYETIVGERGLKLSAGQRQQISIARAYLKDSPILIIDEATSSMDAITEKNIRNSLEQLMNNRTALVIAHRLTTILNMDNLLIFKAGEIIESGNHNNLKKMGGYYCGLWDAQSKDYIHDSLI